MKALWKTLLISCMMQFILFSKTYAVYTYTWTGSSSTTWETSSNWTKTGTGTSTYPGQGGVTTDIVQIGVSSGFTRQPTLSTAITIASLTIGTQTASTLTVNNALTVTGNITLQNNANSANITYGMTGTGSISCNNFYLGDSTTPPLPILGLGSYTFLTTLNFSSLSLNIAQNLYLTTTSAQTSLAYLLISFPAASVDNPVFNFKSGTITVGNQVQTLDPSDANVPAYLIIFPAVSSSAQFLVNPATGNSSILNLNGANAISLDGKAGYVDLYAAAGGTATVNYGGAVNQEVYTSSTGYSYTRQSPTGLSQTPQIYQNLIFSGSMTKKADAGNLTVGNNLTLAASSTETVDFATNSPVITVGGNFVSNTGTTLNQGGTGTMAITGTSTNAGTLNQTGSGNITFTGALSNSLSTSIISQTGTGSIIASGGITNSGAITQGSGTIGNITVTGALTNAGTVTQTTGNISISTDLINSGILTLGSANLTVSGNYTNSGTYTQSTGTTLFNGSSAENMQGGSVAGTLFRTVNFSGAGLKTMSSGNFAVASTSVLTMIGSSTLAASGYLTLNSDSTGSATVAAIPTGASITGNVNVQRYITGGSSTYRGYRLLSSPVTSGSGDYSLNYIINSCYLTGTLGISGGMDKTGNPTLYLYRENLAPLYTTFLNSNYRGINNISTAPAYGMDDTTYPTINIPIGDGYLFFYRGNRAAASLTAETTTTYVPTTTTLTATGVLNAGTITVKDWYTPASSNLGYTSTTANSTVRGFNLVGNPYASSINWDNYSSTSSSAPIYAPYVTKYVYVLDPISKNYGVYGAGTPSGTGTNNSTNIIVSGQGFIVQADSSIAKLTFSESAKTNTQVIKPQLLFATNVVTNPMQYLRLQLFKDSVDTEDMVVQFNSNASPKYVFDEDAPYMQGFGEVNMYCFSSDNVALAIDALPFPGQTPDSIRLDVDAKTAGVYQLNLTELDAIPQLYDIWVLDKYMKDSIDMRQNKSYSFNIYKSDSTSFGGNRFMLIIRQDAAYAYKLLNFTATKVTGVKQVQVAWNTLNEGTNTNFSVQRSIDTGKTFSSIGSVTATGAGNYSLIDKSPVTGQNLYRLQQQDVNNNITYSNVVTVTFSDDALLANNLSIYPNPVQNNINVTVTAKTDAAATNYDIKFMDSSGIIVKEAISQESAWQGNVSNLLPGTYIVQVTNNKDSSLIGKTKFVKY